MSPEWREWKPWLPFMSHRLYLYRRGGSLALAYIRGTRVKRRRVWQSQVMGYLGSPREFNDLDAAKRWCERIIERIELD